MQQPGNILQFMLHTEDDDGTGKPPASQFFKVDRRQTRVAYLRMFRKYQGPAKRILTFELRESTPQGKIIHRYYSKLVIFIGKYDF